MICTQEHWDFKTIFIGLLRGLRLSNFQASILFLFPSQSGTPLLKTGAINPFCEMDLFFEKLLRK